MAKVEGIAVNGEIIDRLEDKNFCIVNKPVYVELPKINNPEEKEKKLLLNILLSDASIMDYYPNKTSIKAMAELWGYEMDDWENKSHVFEIELQKVGKDKKKVIYVQREEGS